ncbi:hypothetical protein GS399_06855 [Pedobacter sp. HMF7647]|uniref:Uncharacterized protein n=1 Tax=Hufsiella arboris TaxID=2695275 RepID=A0A7K1Y9G5_9SPHI|nr:hypothetical protein [Hufsiella arboris]MXV50688.1 hypothetical protein [Hufsiella arboris]
MKSQDKNKELKSDEPMAEKDEVKQAEKRTQKKTLKNTVASPTNQRNESK